MTQKPCYLFVGNPGSGKSTLINGFIGEPLFKSGTSMDGAGLTYQFDKVEIPGMGLFMDTPGLADEERMRAAAASITEALKQNGFYRIFFVMTVESGRVRPADKTTMRLILDAAPTITDYSVILNKVEKPWLEKMTTTDTEVQQRWITALMSGLPVLSASVFFMARDEFLVDQDNVKFKATLEVINFIRQAPGMVIDSNDVQDVHADEFERFEKEHEEMLSKLYSDKEALVIEFNKQKEEMKLAVDKAEVAAKLAVDEAKDAAKLAERRAEAANQKIIEKSNEHLIQVQKIRKIGDDAVKARADDASEMDKLRAACQAATQKAQEAAKKVKEMESAPSGWNIFGRIILGIATAGISEAAVALSKA